MKTNLIIRISIACALLIFPIAVRAQKKPSAPTPSTLLTQTITRNESQRLGFGGTVTITGAPEGSITVEGWQRNEVAVTGEIELKAPSEEDLKLLSTVNGFVFDEDLNHIRVLSVGTHDKEYMKRAGKNFPKRLLSMPWKINYRVRVPLSTDLEIDAGRGPIKISGVEGAIRITAPETEAQLEMTGGTLLVTIAAGKLDLKIPVRSWRGAGADVRVAVGTLNVELAPGFNGDINAEILRAGMIESSFETLASREKPGITPRLVKARAGAGGAFFQFTMGDGTISFRKAGN